MERVKAAGVDGRGEECVLLYRDETRSVSPVLKERPVWVEKRIQICRLKGAEPAEHHQIVAAGHDIDRVQLQEADASDRFQECLLVRKRGAPVESLFHDGQNAGRVERQLDGVRACLSHVSLSSKAN
jgi:hypothetical protein